MLGSEETHNLGQEATMSACVFGIKLLHASIELAHFFRVRLSPQMRLDRAAVVSVSESHLLVLFRELDLA
jgi:hypothetical protein